MVDHHSGLTSGTQNGSEKLNNSLLENINEIEETKAQSLWSARNYAQNKVIFDGYEDKGKSRIHLGKWKLPE